MVFGQKNSILLNKYKKLYSLLFGGIDSIVFNCNVYSAIYQMELQKGFGGLCLKHTIYIIWILLNGFIILYSIVFEKVFDIVFRGENEIKLLSK